MWQLKMKDLGSETFCESQPQALHCIMQRARLILINQRAQVLMERGGILIIFYENAENKAADYTYERRLTYNPKGSAIRAFLPPIGCNSSECSPFFNCV
jgi:hypothetical protein